MNELFLAINRRVMSLDLAGELIVPDVKMLDILCNLIDELFLTLKWEG